MLTIIAASSLIATASAFTPTRPFFAARRTALKANIVETAESAGTFKTLVAAVKAADLGSTLTGPGPYTVFAPSDEAFAKLPEGTVDDLLKDIPKLKSILTYHVVSGKVPASEVTTMDGKKAATVNGAEVAIKVDSDGVMVNEAKVTQTDIMCDNGVIHVLDSVLMPPAEEAATETK